MSVICHTKFWQQTKMDFGRVLTYQTEIWQGAKIAFGRVANLLLA